jgi:hypothetical protein
MFNRIKPLLRHSSQIKKIHYKPALLISDSIFPLYFNEYVKYVKKEIKKNDDLLKIIDYMKSQQHEEYMYRIDLESSMLYDILEYFYDNNIHDDRLLISLYDILYKSTPKYSVFLSKIKGKEKDFDKYMCLELYQTSDNIIDYLIGNYRFSIACLICKYCSSDIKTVNEYYKKHVFDKYMKKIDNIDRKKAQKLLFECLVESISCGNIDMYNHIILNYEYLLTENNAKSLLYKNLFEAFEKGCDLRRFWYMKLDDRNNKLDVVVKIGIDIYNYMNNNAEFINSEMKDDLFGYRVKIVRILNDLILYNETSNLSCINSVIELEGTSKIQLAYRYVPIIKNAIERDKFSLFIGIIGSKFEFNDYEIKEIYRKILTCGNKEKSVLPYLKVMIENGYKLPEKYKHITDDNKEIFMKLFQNDVYFGSTMILLIKNGLQFNPIYDMLLLLNKY